MQLKVQIQGQDMLFLVDSGSSSCFIDEARASFFTGIQKMEQPVRVKVAGGALLSCTDHFPQLQWSSHGHQFEDSFRVLSLNSYDGILGLDWLAKYSPMITH